MGDDYASLRTTANRASSRILITLAIVTILLIVGAVWWQITQLAAIENYEDCAARYPVMDSYPPQCRTPDGRLFIEEISR